MYRLSAIFPALLLLSLLRVEHLSAQDNSTNSPPPPSVSPSLPPPTASPPPSSPPSVFPNPTASSVPPPPPITAACSNLISEATANCGGDFLIGAANFSAPSCCASIYLANQATCFANTSLVTVNVQCTLNSETLQSLLFICGLTSADLFLPTGTACSPPPVPPSPPPLAPDLAPSTVTPPSSAQDVPASPSVTGVAPPLGSPVAPPPPNSSVLVQEPELSGSSSRHHSSKWTAIILSSAILLFRFSI